jgi:hypothetical protein
MIQEEETNQEEEVAPEIEVEEPEVTEEAPQDLTQEQQVIAFYSNLAEEIDERVLGRMANELLADYKKDKESRSDW